MKKLFTLALALMGLTTVANAADVKDIAPCKHSYIVSMDEVTNKGAAKPGKGVLFGDNHFLDVTGGSVATNKGKVNLADAETIDAVTYEGFSAKWGEAGESMNSFRLKGTQDNIAVSLTAGSKIYVFGQNHASRHVCFSKKADFSELVAGQVASGGSIVGTWTADDDCVVYIGSQENENAVGKSADYFISFIVIEANEAEGTPMVKVGTQTYENGLWFIDVTATPVVSETFGETGLTYTVDGTDPLTSDTKKVYDGAPIRCYENTTVKFQAWMKGLEGVADCEMPGADNEGYATFKFNAPKLTVDGGHVTIESEYLEQGGTNVYAYNDMVEEGNEFTLAQSATVKAWTVIKNGDKAEFESPYVITDVYVLNPIAEKKVIAVTSGNVVKDEEATANATDGQTVYTVIDGAISADPMDFFVKDLTFKAVIDREKDKDAQYQVPAGQEVYIQMSNTNISFNINKPVHVKVITTLNSCKTLNPTNDENITTDRKNYVNVSGATFGNDDVTAENGNVIEFDLPKKVTTEEKDEDGNVISTKEEFEDVSAGKVFTFQKYSGTGNILISSIEIEPLAVDAIQSVEAAPANANAAAYNLAGQKVANNFHGIVIKNGKKVVK